MFSDDDKKKTQEPRLKLGRAKPMFKVAEPVGPSMPNKPDDVMKVRRAMVMAGRLPRVGADSSMAESAVQDDLFQALGDMQEEAGMFRKSGLFPDDDSEALLNAELIEADDGPDGFAKLSQGIKPMDIEMPRRFRERAEGKPPAMSERAKALLAEIAPLEAEESAAKGESDDTDKAESAGRPGKAGDGRPPAFATPLSGAATTARRRSQRDETAGSDKTEDSEKTAKSEDDGGKGAPPLGWPSESRPKEMSDTSPPRSEEPGPTKRAKGQRPDRDQEDAGAEDEDQGVEGKADEETDDGQTPSSFLDTADDAKADRKDAGQPRPPVQPADEVADLDAARDESPLQADAQLGEAEGIASDRERRNRRSRLVQSQRPALRPKDDGEWQGAYSTITTPNPSVVTHGPIRIDIENPGLGVDGTRYTLKWEPLDENGDVRLQVMKPGSGVDEHGGHSLPLGSNTQIIDPPFENQHGWRVTIEQPPQGAVSGNSAKPYLNIYTRPAKNAR